MHGRFLIPILTLLALVLPACGGLLRQDAPPKRFHLLEAGPPGVERDRPILDATALVRDIEVAPPFNKPSLIYRTGPTTIETDYYNLFLAPPGELITQQLRQWLRRANVFRHVVAPASSLDHEYVVEGLVTQLHGDFTGDTNRAVVAAQLFLLRDGPERPVLLSREYRREIPLEEDSPSGLVRAMGQGLTEILRRFAADVGDLASSRGAGLP